MSKIDKDFNKLIFQICDCPTGRHASQFLEEAPTVYVRVEQFIATALFQILSQIYYVVR